MNEEEKQPIMSNTVKGVILKWTSIIIDVVPPLIATLCQFPLWVKDSQEKTMSGIGLLLLICCLVPFWKQIREWLKAPSNWVAWIAIFVFLLVMQHIAKDIVPIAFVGMISNIIGAIVHRIGKIVASKDATIIQQQDNLM